MYMIRLQIKNVILKTSAIMEVFFISNGSVFIRRVVILKEITVEELYHKNHPVVIDIRSPIEFKDDAIPGAINIPLFTDEERQEIGTIYKQEGQDQAKWRAMEIVSPKIPKMLESIKIASSESNEQPIIHCWRGGMRSKAVVTFLDYAGIRAKRLTGGYKAYRQYI